MSSYQQGSIISAYYNVWISGTEISEEKKSCIKSIKITETVQGSDSASLVIADPDFLYIEDDIFVEDNKIKIQLGWSDTSYVCTFAGYISAIDIDFASDGIPVLTITCMDNTHVMNKEKKDATFSNTTSADVVKKLAKQYGFNCVVEKDYSFTKQETITQSNQTDIEFISSLADNEVYPFTARLVDDTFYYVKLGKLETPKMELTYREYPHEIISFKPKINKESKKTAITSSSVSTSTKGVSTTKGTSTKSSGSSTSKGSSAKSTSSGTSGGNTSTSKSTSYKYDPKTKTWTKK